TPNYKGNKQAFQVKEGFLSNSNSYIVKRDFIIEGLPEWAWTKAEKFKPTAENMKKLYQAYQEIWDLINKKDSNGLKAKTKIAFSEYDKAEGYKEGTWYKTFG